MGWSWLNLHQNMSISIAVKACFFGQHLEQTLFFKTVVPSVHRLECRARPWSHCTPSHSDWDILLSTERSPWHPDVLYLFSYPATKFLQEKILFCFLLSRLTFLNRREAHRKGRNIENCRFQGCRHCERADLKLSDLWAHSANGTSYSVKVRSS